jgi:MFS family permease
MTSVAAERNCTASLASIQNFGGYLGGALAPTITAFIVQTTSSFRQALLVGALIAFSAGVAHLVLVGEPISPGRDGVN